MYDISNALKMLLNSRELQKNQRSKQGDDGFYIHQSNHPIPYTKFFL